ncbi:2,3-epoxybenzoyl-CoA dihydrolase [Desertibaculum subflavum]|uniref:2,3-epoxybenzoyl-CoA dihydrolase n=1 Tax=Desertibaculum subflavum TaxID=2268458 RepID=UPI000E660346
MLEFRTDPSRYKHWKLAVEGRVATLALDVAEGGGLFPGYELKLNSYDLGVDIELADAMLRLRFEHPEVGAVVVTSAKDRVFCAGANIRMLSGATHGHKVNFCKFTNETRNAIEDASVHSGQVWLAAVNGACAGGGYELALACEKILLIDDGSSAVSLPEVPLLAVLPGTGGLTRLVDKRKVRRDRADFFCTTEEGLRGKRAVEWRLVDEVVPRSRFTDTVAARATELAAQSARPAGESGIALPPLARAIDGDRIDYDTLTLRIDRERGAVEIIVKGPTDAPPYDVAVAKRQGAAFWPLSLARALDDAILHLRFNEETIGTWVLRSEGMLDAVAAYDALLARDSSDWFIREATLYLKRVLKRLDLSARTIFGLVEPGSCFAGTLAELLLAADRVYMLDGSIEGDNRPPARVRLTPMNFGAYPMVTGLTRLKARLQDDATAIADAAARIGEDLDAAEAEKLGLATFTPDEIDWEDEVRLAIEERAAFSPDALTGLEASLRFPGPETMESKIFARLSAWQNWIFQRPNAVGPAGALKRYGTGQRPEFDRGRV